MLNTIDFNDNKICLFAPSKKMLIKAALFTKQISGFRVMVSGLLQEQLDSIVEYRGVEVLFLQDCTKQKEISFIYELNDLKDLTIGGFGADLNLSKLVALESLSIDWGGWFNSMREDARIKRLSIWKCKEKNLASLSRFPSVKSLSVTQSSIDSLLGIERLENIESLTLAQNRNLLDLTNLKSTKLKKLTIENSKKIIDYSFLTEMRSLEELKISNCAPINSMSVIGELESLKSCRIFGTKIVDKDLHLLKNLSDHYYG